MPFSTLPPRFPSPLPTTLRYFRGSSRVGILSVYRRSNCLFCSGSLQGELIKPAVNGTLNVLTSCAKVPSLKRVVLTSSMAAVLFSERPLGPDLVVDETWFSDPAFCEKSKVCPCPSFQGLPSQHPVQEHRLMFLH